MRRESTAEVSQAIDEETRQALSRIEAGELEETEDRMVSLAAYYFLKAKLPSGKPMDPVARFHLGNGARLEKINFLGDPSKKGMKQSFGLMVNYLYALEQVEENHEEFAQHGKIIASNRVKKALRASLDSRDLVVSSEDQQDGKRSTTPS